MYIEAHAHAHTRKKRERERHNIFISICIIRRIVVRQRAIRNTHFRHIVSTLSLLFKHASASLSQSLPLIQLDEAIRKWLEIVKKTHQNSQKTHAMKIENVLNAYCLSFGPLPFQFFEFTVLFGDTTFDYD